MNTRTRIRPLTRRSAGFSLVELIIVVVIIGLLAAIAIPRFSKGAANTNLTAFAGDMAVLRNALELYAVEHGGNYPGGLTFERQLTEYTDADGNPSVEPAGGFDFGPYLVAVPVLKVGTAGNKGSSTVSPVDGTPQGEVAGAGWLYHPASGRIWPNDDTRF